MVLPRPGPKLTSPPHQIVASRFRKPTRGSPSRNPHATLPDDLAAARGGGDQRLRAAGGRVRGPRGGRRGGVTSRGRGPSRTPASQQPVPPPPVVRRGEEPAARSRQVPG